MLEITLREGRKRQVRRMCEAVGHRVVELERVAFGPLGLRGLRARQEPAAQGRRGRAAAPRGRGQAGAREPRRAP